MQIRYPTRVPKQDAHSQWGLGVIMRPKCDNDDDLRSLSSRLEIDFSFLHSTIGISRKSFMIDSNYGPLPEMERNE